MCSSLATSRSVLDRSTNSTRMPWSLSLYFTAFASPSTLRVHSPSSWSGHLSFLAVNHSSSRSFQESTGSPRFVIPKPALT